MGLRRASRRLDRLVRGIWHSERDVVADRRGEEERVLGDDADLAAERSSLDVPNVHAVDENAAGDGVVEPRNEAASVVFPEPVGPMSAIVRPAGTSSVTSSSTGRSGS